MTPSEVANLKFRASQALAGPWRVRALENFGWNVVVEDGWNGPEPVRVAKSHCEATANYMAAANPATIRALIAENEALDGCRSELEAVSLAIGSGVRFMDPPDGGSVTIAEQVVRMRIALHEAEAENEAKDAEIERLREALTFYASDKRWDDLANEVRRAELALDEGEKARQALTRKDGE